MYGTARRRRARVSHGGVAGELTSRPNSRVAQGAGGGRGVVVCLQHGLLGGCSPFVCVHSGVMEGFCHVPCHVPLNSWCLGRNRATDQGFSIPMLVDIK